MCSSDLEIVLAGGGELYAALLDRADRIELTEVDLAPPGETRFPVLDPAQWREISREEGVRTPADEAAFRFVTFERRARSAPPVENNDSGA